MDLEATYQRGYECRCLGQYAEAKAIFQTVLAEDPNHVQTRHQIGLIQGFEGDFDASLVTLTDLCAQFPTNNDIRYDLAMTQMMLGENDSACANFRQILANDPHHENANKQVIYC